MSSKLALFWLYLLVELSIQFSEPKESKPPNQIHPHLHMQQVNFFCILMFFWLDVFFSLLLILWIEFTGGQNFELTNDIDHASPATPSPSSRKSVSTASEKHVRLYICSLILQASVDKMLWVNIVRLLGSCTRLVQSISCHCYLVREHHVLNEQFYALSL